MAVYCLGLVLLMTGAAHAQNLRLEAQLVWATDEPTSPNAKHHPVDPDIARRLANGPYRWKNYFEVNRQSINIAVGETKTKIPMSDHCTLDIKNMGANRVEIKLHGDGKDVSTHRESLANKHLFVVAGDAGNKTGWLVTIRQKADPLASSK